MRLYWSKRSVFMKNYVKPEISVVEFDKDDIALVVTSSSDDLQGGEAVGFW